jgi:hypothetical protein
MNWVSVRRFPGLSQWHAAKAALLRVGVQSLLGDGEPWTDPGPCPPGRGIALMVPQRRVEQAVDVLARSGFIS